MKVWYWSHWYSTYLLLWSINMLIISLSLCSCIIEIRWIYIEMISHKQAKVNRKTYIMLKVKTVAFIHIRTADREIVAVIWFLSRPNPVSNSEIDSHSQYSWKTVSFYSERQLLLSYFNQTVSLLMHSLQHVKINFGFSLSLCKVYVGNVMDITNIWRVLYWSKCLFKT